MTRRRIFDAHLHVVDPRFPLVENDGYVPAPFPTSAYLERVRDLGVRGGAVVAGSFQGADQSFLADALRRLGPTFVGVTNLPDGATDRQIEALDEIGVRAVRLNLRRGERRSRAEIAHLGNRVKAAAGWHLELYVDASELAGLLPALEGLTVVVDHLGLSAGGFASLLGHVSRGGYVKASGFGRVDLNVPDALRAISRENPAALLFGTDLPSTRAPRPFNDVDVALIEDALGAHEATRALFWNAVALYRPSVSPAPASAT